MNLSNLPVHVQEALPKGLFLLGYRGSHAHGLHTPETDDTDLMGVYVAPLEHYFGLGRQDTFELLGEWDVVSYEVKKFFGLLLKCNPNVISLLWLPEDKYILKSPLGEALIQNRDVFSSQAAYHSFSGYAWGQLSRMEKAHEEVTCCKGEIFHEEACPLKAVKGRGSSKRFATGYMGVKRKALVEKHGYDTKNAAHLIRLLKMGREFLLTGKLQVDRSNIDRDELLDIKNGRFSLEEVKKLAEYLFGRMEVAKEGSPLPERPDEAAAESILLAIICQATKSFAR